MLCSLACINANAQPRNKEERINDPIVENNNYNEAQNEINSNETLKALKKIKNELLNMTILWYEIEENIDKEKIQILEKKLKKLCIEAETIYKKTKNYNDENSRQKIKKEYETIQANVVFIKENLKRMAEEKKINNTNEEEIVETFGRIRMEILEIFSKITNKFNNIAFSYYNATDNINKEIIEELERELETSYNETKTLYEISGTDYKSLKKAIEEIKNDMINEENFKENINDILTQLEIKAMKIPEIYIKNQDINKNMNEIIEIPNTEFEKYYKEVKTKLEQKEYKQELKKLNEKYEELKQEITSILKKTEEQKRKRI